MSLHRANVPGSLGITFRPRGRRAPMRSTPLLAGTFISVVSLGLSACGPAKPKTVVPNGGVVSNAPPGYLGPPVYVPTSFSADGKPSVSPPQAHLRLVTQLADVIINDLNG